MSEHSLTSHILSSAQIMLLLYFLFFSVIPKLDSHYFSSSFIYSLYHLLIKSTRDITCFEVVTEVGNWSLMEELHNLSCQQYHCQCHSSPSFLRLRIQLDHDGLTFILSVIGWATFSLALLHCSVTGCLLFSPRSHCHFHFFIFGILPMFSKLSSLAHFQQMVWPATPCAFFAIYRTFP